MVLGGRPPGRVGRSHVIFFIYRKYNYKNDMFHEELYNIKRKNTW